MVPITIGGPVGQFAYEYNGTKLPKTSVKTHKNLIALLTLTEWKLAR